MSELREALADLCHRQWSGWMEYMFSPSRSQTTDAGEKIIPPWAVERWTRQMRTPYAALSEAEQDSDRKEADKFLEVIRGQHLRDRPTAIDIAFHDCRRREQAALERAVQAEQEIDRLQGLVRDCRRKDETGQACLERMLTNGRMVLIAETRERGLLAATNDAERRASEAIKERDEWKEDAQRMRAEAAVATGERDSARLDRSDLRAKLDAALMEIERLMTLIREVKI